MIYTDRFDAADKISIELENYKNDSQVIIVGIPRGGVEVSFRICEKLNFPMEVTIAKKIGAPFSSELAIGAVSEKNTVILNNSLIKSLNILDDYIRKEIEKQKKEIEKRLESYRQGKYLINFENKKVIIVDDGIATGATIKAVIQLLKNSNAKKITVAVPVAPKDTIEEIRNICDEVICPLIPDFFNSVGSFYRNFNQTTDEEVIDFIRKIKEKNKNDS